MENSKIASYAEVGKKYFVTKGSENGYVKVGEPLEIRCDNQGGEKESWSLFLICRVGKSEYKRLGAEKNDVRNFPSRKDLDLFLSGAEVQPDTKWAREKIDLLQHEIKDIEKRYGLEV